eukprot:CAMPEP_0171107584 /NCGR_PEP_ID=MMETSP0766_2-20121228/67120_1 /TAXON_ID=439317 /ORGANISM="Gambierdiscus australes, Strain CAWD 149" /LENGTH=357 /DNA_ID=CAMNT_0011568927 /DNA_START=77 /DNA_END=1150 /DNA_ORIENTATION=-
MQLTCMIRVSAAITCGLLACLMQGCVKKRKECSAEDFNCMETGCCIDESLKCFASSDTYASCQASCEPGFGKSCEEILPGGKAKSTTTPAPTPAPVVHEGDVEWKTGTWTTGYWDCCKPSCAWSGKGKTDRPAAACSTETGERLTDSNVASVCDGGTAAACANNQPFIVNQNLSMGFVAAAVSGKNGLEGDKNCGQCYELLFTSQQHMDKGTGDLWGGSNPDLSHKRMIVQITNIGFDVKGSHSFDILIPGAGQGIFSKGCAAQYSHFSVDDFDCGKRHGGCSKKSECARLPEALRAGCEWRFDWFRWLREDEQTNNPYVKFRRVQCPLRITDISGTTPDDDEFFSRAHVSPDFYYA